MNSVSLNWGPPVLLYDLDNESFTKIKNTPPETKIKQGDPGFLQNPIKGRYYYSDRSKEEIKECIDSYIRDYMKKTLIHNGELSNNDFNKVEYCFSSLWANDYKDNQNVTQHIHSCDISFLLYLKIDSKLLKEEPYPSGCTVFKYGEEQDARALIPFLNSNFITPKEGQLIVFPNNLNHYTVPFHNPNLRRVTLSGNIDIQLSNW